jgi:hypothetical protein
VHFRRSIHFRQYSIAKLTEHRPANRCRHGRYHRRVGLAPGSSSRSDRGRSDIVYGGTQEHLCFGYRNCGMCLCVQLDCANTEYQEGKHVSSRSYGAESVSSVLLHGLCRACHVQMLYITMFIVGSDQWPCALEASTYTQGLSNVMKSIHPSSFTCKRCIRFPIQLSQHVFRVIVFETSSSPSRFCVPGIRQGRLARPPPFSLEVPQLRISVP